MMCYNRNILRVCITLKIRRAAQPISNIGTLKFGFKAHKGVLRKDFFMSFFDFLLNQLNQRSTFKFLFEKESKIMEKSICTTKAGSLTNQYQRNLKRIIAEMVLTSIGAGFSVSTITVFWNSIGMDQTKIGFVQMMYTLVVLILDIPMGYLADRFNRKVLNIIGDIGIAVSFVYYAFAKNMYSAIISESLLALFTAMTSGVDRSFLKSTSKRINPSKEYYNNVSHQYFMLKYIAMFVVILTGGFISKISLRLSIGLSFIPYFIGGIIAFGIVDYADKAEVNKKTLFEDMKSNFKKLMKVPKIRLYMICYILGKEITHSQIWVFTPLLLRCGVPSEFACIGWMLNHLMQMVGMAISNKMSKFKMSHKFIWPVVIELTWILALVFHTNIVTVWLFAINGLVCGMVDGNLLTPLQEETEEELQTQVMSITSTGGRLLYIPMVFITNYLGKIKLELALIWVFVVFLPICLISYAKLKHMEK